MDMEIDDLLKRLDRLEEEFEKKIEARQAAFRYRIENGRAKFEEGVQAEQRRLKTNLLRFFRESRLPEILSAPVIYAMIVPFVFLDIAVTIYQLVCFSLWRIEPARRDDYIVIDRHRLAYLNAIEKLNCVYCGYANGLIAYVQEIAGRTEQYWCPIKHARRVRAHHARYRHFLDYGDTDRFHERMQQLRDDLRKAKE